MYAFVICRDVFHQKVYFDICGSDFHSKECLYTNCIAWGIDSILKSPNLEQDENSSDTDMLEQMVWRSYGETR
jgi:hypothetical protein